MNNQNFDAAHMEFCQRLSTRLMEYKNRMGLTYFDYFEIHRMIGDRYIKVLSRKVKSNCASLDNLSIVAFIDKNTGDILKPASWRAPAKHARGNIFSDQFGMEAIDENGFVKYLK